MTDDMTIDLSIPEYLLLLATQQAATPLGLDVAMINGIGPAQIEAALSSLEQRRLVQRLSNGQIDLIRPLNDLLAVCATPHHAVMIDHQQPDGERVKWVLYIGASSSVEARLTGNSEQCQLRRHTAIDSPLTEAMAQLSLSDRPRPVAEPFKTANVLIDREEPAVNPDDRTAFTALWRTASWRATVIRVAYEPTGPTLVDTFGVLDTKDGVYLLLPVPDSHGSELEVVPADRLRVQATLKHMLESALA
jgi:hypothetical protein